MSKIKEKPGLFFFGALVNLDCLTQDLKLVLRKTEEIEFPNHEESPEDESLISDIIPDITRKSFIVTLLIALDDEFRNYCEILREVTDQKLKWNNLRGSALERFIMYSEKVCGIKSVKNERSKQSLKGLIEVRNCIVHNNSDLQEFGRSKMIENFAKTVEGVSTEGGIIEIDCSGCITRAELVMEFMEYAYKAALEVYPQ